MPMLNPSHPGALLREDIVPALKADKCIVGITDLAQRLGYSRPHFSNILHERAPITAELAYRLELAGLGVARNWLAMQSAYDLAQVAQGQQPHIVRLVPEAA
ncbi:HigA family addiction module antitoxin [Pseudomonas sp. DCB_CB]|uniref:HigA family addiction module antitoxin n=1 Tax=unclassified Pseudomonas TaxID=196821 RepID=UPI002248F66C|nr:MULTISPECIES: HigA family addiction module antitoxin [unclassified Pseudomonas]MCX2694480.1 HigA family addiction module antitoxin [Pseudomonas sp. DCB_BZ]MCX2859690.1 HigA family addiction module antitoxin [Pseudomonas sp. DCB_CB]